MRFQQHCCRCNYPGHQNCFINSNAHPVESNLHACPPTLFFIVPKISHNIRSNNIVHICCSDCFDRTMKYIIFCVTIAKPCFLVPGTTSVHQLQTKTSSKLRLPNSNFAIWCSQTASSKVHHIHFGESWFSNLKFTNLLSSSQHVQNFVRSLW